MTLRMRFWKLRYWWRLKWHKRADVTIDSYIESTNYANAIADMNDAIRDIVKEEKGDC